MHWYTIKYLIYLQGIGLHIYEPEREFQIFMCGLSKNKNFANFCKDEKLKIGQLYIAKIIVN